jgi:hypothetical protein
VNSRVVAMKAQYLGFLTKPGDKSDGRSHDDDDESGEHAEAREKLRRLSLGKLLFLSIFCAFVCSFCPFFLCF